MICAATSNPLPAFLAHSGIATTAKKGATISITDSFRALSSRTRKDKLTECSGKARLFAVKGSSSKRSGETFILCNLPAVPQAPFETSAVEFQRQLELLGHDSLAWEEIAPNIRGIVPQEKIANEAQTAYDDSLVIAANIRSGFPPAWDYQECKVRKALESFVKGRINTLTGPGCIACDKPTELSEPVYLCMNQLCYLGPSECGAGGLLQSRPSCGKAKTLEFASLCCAGLDSRRLRLDRGLLQQQQRWIHIDVSDGLWNQPLY